MALRESPVKPLDQETAAAIRDQNEAHAEEAGLRYVTDREPGFVRKRRGSGFYYVDPSNEKVTKDEILARIKSLVIPPAWEGVWICRFKNGHLQVTGRDQRARKQYRYHSKWSETRNETKFNKLCLFGEALPGIRARLKKDLKSRELSREMVLAAVVRIMEKTMIRVGNDEYAEENDSYGLTTIRNNHVKVTGSTANFRFKGKSGVLHESKLSDPMLTRLIRKCQDLPGQELFGYLDANGGAHDVGSSDVNAYLREITGECITAKDFRTWGATVHAATTLFEMGPIEKDKQIARKKRELQAIRSAAEFLNNTATVCRKYYVHPTILEADRDGSLRRAFNRAKKSRGSSSALSQHEEAVLALLQRG